MSYLKSEEINVFPLAKGRTTTQADNMLYEKNVTSLVTQVADTQGYVITKDITNHFSVSGSTITLNSNETFEFSLGGHKISITAPSDGSINLGGTEVWASILLNDDGEIQGQDNDTLYEGVNFTNTQPSESNSISLKLLTITEDNTVKVPEESYQKFNVNSINSGIKFIDGLR